MYHSPSGRGAQLEPVREGCRIRRARPMDGDEAADLIDQERVRRTWRTIPDRPPRRADISGDAQLQGGVGRDSIGWTGMGSPAESENVPAQAVVPNSPATVVGAEPRSVRRTTRSTTGGVLEVRSGVPHAVVGARTSGTTAGPSDRHSERGRESIAVLRVRTFELDDLIAQARPARDGPRRRAPVIGP